jgi:hypothetical protein
MHILQFRMSFSSHFTNNLTNKFSKHVFVIWKSSLQNSDLFHNDYYYPTCESRSIIKCSAINWRAAVFVGFDLRLNIVKHNDSMSKGIVHRNLSNPLMFMLPSIDLDSDPNYTLTESTYYTNSPSNAEEFPFLQNTISFCWWERFYDERLVPSDSLSRQIESFRPSTDLL